jgi:hypothetical protein
MRPFLEVAASHFDPAKKTWTESMIERLERDDAVEVRDPVNAPNPGWPATDVVSGPDPEAPPMCGGPTS